MGRGNRGGRGGGGRGRGRGRGGGGGRGGRGGEDNRVSFERVEKHNDRLERYYNSVLGISDEERSDFWDALRRELPNSFRFAGSKGHALAVQKQLKNRYVPEISKISHYDGTPVEPPQAVPWYPDELAWWMTTPKNVVRKFPPFAAFQKFLVSETSVGNISRQEVVSMIPPLVMDLRPGMTVLDMCAAPGSKAAQLLEMVHNGEEARVRKSLMDHAKEDGRYASPEIKPEGVQDVDLEVDNDDNGRATGLLIANDNDYKRSHMLIHQLKRLSSPNLIVTNHDATIYPSIKLPPTPENPALNRYLKFDRILADVPCSGDGTTRKNVNLWKDWTPGNALGLYVTQVRILVRALQMLKAGGRVVYSTCSMNPIENEAVVASAIEQCGGLAKVHILPSNDQLPLLKRRPGLRDWTVMDKGGKMWSSWAEVREYVDKHGESAYTEKLVEGMFSPKNSEIPLERCMRVYAHLQDTGGFFITILEKKGGFIAKPESENQKIAPKPLISSIVDEIESRPPPKDGESVAPKIEAADGLTQPMKSEDEMPSAAARQNQESATSDGTLVSSKRSFEESDLPQSDDVTPTKRVKTEDDIDSDLYDEDDNANGTKPGDDGKEVDAYIATKALKTKEELDEAAAEGMENRNVHYPPPPGAELGMTTRPGDMRLDSQPKQRTRAGQQFEEPFKYISGDHPEVQAVEKFYNLSPRFPRDRFMVRNAQGEPAKTIYYTSALIRDILTENEGKGIKFIHGGVKMFMKQDVQNPDTCKWRIQSEGMPILEGYVGEERVVRLYKKETLRKLLIEMFPKIADGGWKDLGEIGERVNNIPMGCCVLRIEPSGEADGLDERMVLPLWRSMHSLNLMLAKEDRTAMLLRIFNDTTPLINNSINKQKVKDEDEKPVAPGFKREDGEIKVDTSLAISDAAPVNENAAAAVMKPGPYGVIVAQPPEDNPMPDARSDKIAKGEDTGGPEQQLNGTGGIEGQLGSVN